MSYTRTAEYNGLDHAEKLLTIAAVVPDQVVQVYSGRPGCACGCRGNYSQNPKTIRTILKRLQENSLHAADRDLLVGKGWREGSYYIAVDTGTRAYTAYIGDGWV